MRLQRLLEEAGLRQAVEDKEITGVTADSRRVREGMLFVALRGQRSDGFAHIGEALKRGATFVVSERQAAGAPHIVVPNARRALAYLCDAWYGHPTRDMCLIGVTGTNGKTSTAEMLYHILRCAGYSCGIIGTVSVSCNGEAFPICAADPLANMTTPEPEELYAQLAAMRERGAAYAVMEVTSHALALERVAPLRFQRALFTNLTPDHLDFHIDMESYYAEKRKLFSKCEVAVLSTLSDYGARLSAEVTVPQIAVGRGSITVLQQLGVAGTRFRLAVGEECLDILITVPGGVFVENAALAATAALSLGVDSHTATEALRAFGGVRGRMERVTVPGADISVFLDYAHTPDALERLLQGVRQWRAPEARILLLFGCGGDRDRSKRKEMGQIATRLADLTVLTSDNSRSEEPAMILRDILRGIDKEKAYTVIPDRREAIEFAIRTARSGDIVLLAGKGHEEYEIRGDARLPFSEREIAMAALIARKGGEEHAR
ncbi:MAG: UDP-N-acetylmuramoyl-L-alanyl-D-glutamate--2,6-diaminopimelate ligase [Ruminococcaceae bacterium]|nr:UDP-N-acetylmuramoyl-L-alanyl-D-glutamate--2,6-diaminopimelate ligase [Oscillospiraceae bacterium]